ncbi:MAG TPA: chemotaxis protein CheW [Methylovorus sp.]|jgi:chemotaxis signal transduction protein|nr:chemotaxis protein CheW [Methylovorus sp.]
MPTDQIPSSHCHMIDSMVSLNRYRDGLQQLQNVWDNLSLLSQLSGTGTDMTETRQAFSQVTNDVLNSLAEETLDKTVTSLTSKAQVTVDIVVRNLFERTADIGFLATDDDIRAFLDKHFSGTAYPSDVDALRHRFREYVKKYSVYSNIILLDTEGNVLVQMDEKNPVSHSQDTLITEALETTEAYVEVFRKTDLLPEQNTSLIYAYRVTTTNQRVAGVLCLCFRFENEMEGVFGDLITHQDWAVGLLLDQKGCVVASSDKYQIPIGAPLEVAADKDYLLTRFAGREYIAVTCKTKGYQGYMGPGWIGHAMIPLEHAFDGDIATAVAGIDKKLLAKVMRSPLLFSQTLLGIPKQASTIQNRLNQSVWNGNIWQKRESGQTAHQSSFSKTLLWEISNTGFKTQNVIETTVSDLYQTVVSVMLENSRFFASLAVDIMDRNLYERANDCRWWALTTTFRQLLSHSNRSRSDVAAIEKVLSYINGLYTVYANLVVFDRQGEIIAVSNPAYNDCVGTFIEAEWMSRLRGLRSSQDYVVSRFEATPLYKNKPTYVYAAAIRSEDDVGIVGGIGIVFDSAPQFSAMLTDALPRDTAGEPIPGSFTLYVDGDLQVISSTLPAFSVGSTFTIQPALCKLAPGEAAFDIVLHEGRYYAVGARASSGYREFKGPNDPYQNPVTALIFIPLGNAADIDAMISSDNTYQHTQFKPTSSSTPVAGAEEYATFYVGSEWMALPAGQVLEAVQPENIKQLPESAHILEGVMQHRGGVIPVLNLAKLINTECHTAPENRQVIVIEATEDSPRFGILVSALGEIPSIVPSSIELIATIFSIGNTPAEGVTRVKSDNGKDNLLIVLSTQSLWKKIHNYQQALENNVVQIAA